MFLRSLRRRLGFFFFVFFAVAGPFAEGTSQTDLRYEAADSRPNTLHTSFYWTSGEPGPWRVKLGTRLGLSDRLLEHFTYAAAGEFAPCRWFQTEARMLHVNRLNPGTAWTTFLLQGKVQTPDDLGVQAFGAFGVYRRLVQLQDAIVLPTWMTSYSEWDLATTLGVRVRPAKVWSGSLAVSTIDSLDVFNLSHPFLESVIKYSPVAETWSASIFYRYQLLLGFGRLDAWVLGAGIDWH